jgi:metal-dependent amidase/aminoacylase/carboxypeptidase family protein
MGTPAEEDGGGKKRLLDAGAFDGVNFAMMVHPSPIDVLEPAILSVEDVMNLISFYFRKLTFEEFSVSFQCHAEFHGKASHASVGPSEGINALDAVVGAYNNLSMLRQQLPVANQVHMIISAGGSRPNVIPHYTKMEYSIRAPNERHMTQLRQKTLACFQAAATATGQK